MVSQAFQTSFSNILVRYSKSLQNSCKTTAEKEAVRFILNKCQHITRAIWVKVQSEAESSQDQDFSYPDLEALPTSKQETLERHRYLQDTNVDITYEMSTVDDDFMDEPEDATEDKANWNDPFVLEEVKDFLREHEAFAELLLRFDYVVHGSLLHLAILNDDETAVLHLLRDGMELGDQHRDGQMAFALAVELAFKRHQSTLVDLMLNFRDQSRQDLIDQESLKIDSGEFLESLNEGSGSMKDIIICDCEIPEVIHQLQSSVSERKVSQERIDVEQERDLLRMLSNVVVITGSEAAYEAMACGNYLEKYWGKLGIDLLSAIVDGHKQIVLNQPDFLARPIKALVASNRIILSFANVHSWLDKFDLRKALLWLCQAVRLPPASGTFTQLIHLSTICEIKFPFSRYFIKPLEPLILKEDNCWVELFNPGVVASRCLRRSLRRNSGRGLEIPFDMMVQLAAVENCSWIESRSHNTSSREDGGYVLLGFYTALIPMQASEDGKSIQWHLEHSKGEILQPSSLASIRGDWLMVKDPNVFVKTKCFIGWCGRANVMLGTQDLPNTVAWSGLPTRNRTLHKKGNTATAQVAGTGGPIQIALQGAQNYEYVTNRQHFKANSAYAGAITEISRQVALVYDSETKQAWLVPKISLLLHLCHTYFQFYKNSSSQVVDPIPFAVPSADGSQAAEDAFAGNGGTVVIEHSPTDQILLRQVLVDINTCISEAVKTREAPKGSILLGSELMDLVIKPGTGSDLVEVKMSSPADAWLNLVELVDAILVCSKLGQALKPVPEVPLPTTPCDCMNLPTQSLYLAAHLWCLEKLLERRNCHVSYLQTAVVEIKKDRVWGLSGQPFRQCQHPLNNTYWADSKNILQKVSRQGLLHSKISATPSVWPVPLQGAVVFGIPPQNVLQKKK
ncbi:hypothetical protein N431DRAFT_429912 [Stipitochalara longipes BDJ]|nr:hypothetical protein N431DRAFT_429912 [Stipitochalara longipes BDJ]